MATAAPLRTLIDADYPPTPDSAVVTLTTLREAEPAGWKPLSSSLDRHTVLPGFVATAESPSSRGSTHALATALPVAFSCEAPTLARAATSPPWPLARRQREMLVKFVCTGPGSASPQGAFAAAAAPTPPDAFAAPGTCGPAASPEISGTFSYNGVELPMAMHRNRVVDVAFTYGAPVDRVAAVRQAVINTAVERGEAMPYSFSITGGRLKAL